MRQFRAAITEIATFPGQVRVRCRSAGPSAAAGQYFLAEAPVPAQPFLRLVAWLWRDGVPAWAASLLPPSVEFHAGALSNELVAWADRVLLDVPDLAEVAVQLRNARPLRPGDFLQAVLLPPTPCATGVSHQSSVISHQSSISNLPQCPASSPWSLTPMMKRSYAAGRWRC